MFLIVENWDGTADISTYEMYEGLLGEAARKELIMIKVLKKREQPPNRGP